jgi:UTP--glucose-1-phosphate uridylyltransferase
MPKEMLPIVDKPLIQYAVEEAIQAGATRLVFITGSTKRSIEDHFDRDAELERALESADKLEMLNVVRNILPSGVSCVYIRQGDPLGLGHAVLCSRPAVGNEPFFVHLPDDLIRAPHGCLAQMRQQYESHGASVLAVEEVERSQTSSYGIVDVDKTQKLRQIVEKPAPEKAPSTLAVVGRYLLTPAIFDLLEKTGRGAGGEIQLTDGIAALLRTEPVFAFRFAGHRYDCGSKVGYIKAIVDFAMEDPALRSQLQAHLATLAL